MIRIFQKLVGGVSLRAGLLLLLGLVAAILVTDQVRQALYDRAKGIQAAERQLTEVASHAARRQADMITEARALLGVVATLPEVAEGSIGSCHLTLASVVLEVAWLSRLSSVLPSGHPVCSSEDTAPDVWIGDRPYFVDTLATRAFVLSDYVISRVSGKPALVAAMPRIGQDGGVASVLVGVIDLDWLSRLTADAGVLTDSVVLLVDSQMTAITAYPHPENWIGRPISREQTLRDFMEVHDDTPDVISLDGKNWVVAHKTLSGSRAQIVVLQPEATVLVDADQQAKARLVEIGFIALVLSLAVWLGGEYLVVRPITALTATTARLGSGDLAARVGTNFVPRDFQILGRALNEMASDFEHRDAQLHSANAKLEQLASTDGLTGLANRRLFDQMLETEWQRAEREGRCVAVVQFDVDYFKQFNDRYGHIAGDDCLRAVAGVLKSGARRAGDLAGRTGGEEFTLLLPMASLEHAAMIADQVRKRIRELGIVHAGSPTGFVTISGGVASLKPYRGGSSSLLVDAADRALYSAKRAGRNCTHSDAVAEASSGTAAA